MATLRAMPVLLVSEVEAAAGFYESLGFHCHGYLGDPPDFAVVQRGDVTLALNAAPGPRSWPDGAWRAYIYVSDVEALHAELTAAGATVTALADQPYGCREFQTIDADGNRLAFGQDMVTTDAAPGLGVERGAG